MNPQPQRIQRMRRKGWRLPPNTVCVTRPGKWGNPFRVEGWYRWDEDGKWSTAAHPGMPGFVEVETRAMAVAYFEKWLRVTRPDLSELREKNLACWCRLGEALPRRSAFAHGERDLAVAK